MAGWWPITNRAAPATGNQSQDSGSDTKEKDSIVSVQRVKKKGKWGGGRQPRSHPKPPAPVIDRPVQCPVCKQVFVCLIESPPGAYNFEAARQFIGGPSPATFRRMVGRGLIRPNRATRHLYFGREELLRYIRDNTAL